MRDRYEDASLDVSWIRMRDTVARIVSVSKFWMPKVFVSNHVSHPYPLDTDTVSVSAQVYTWTSFPQIQQMLLNNRMSLEQLSVVRAAKLLSLLDQHEFPNLWKVVASINAGNEHEKHVNSLKNTRLTALSIRAVSHYKAKTTGPTDMSNLPPTLRGL